MYTGQGGGAFARAGNLPVAAGRVALGDLDADGKLDLATTHLVAAPARAAFIGVQRGNGDATFGPMTRLDTDPDLSALQLVDLNRDGASDIVCTHLGARPDYTGGGISWFLNRGDGNFGARQDLALGTFTWQVAAGDLNADGIPDLAGVYWGADSDPHSGGTVFLGRGDGTFGPRIDFETGRRPQDLAIADLNGDGMLDLAIAVQGKLFVYQDGGIEIHPGRGNGTFGPPFLVGGGASATSVLARDLNGDGRIDLALANFYGHSIDVLPGDGQGGFGPGIGYGAGIFPALIGAADVNGDTRPDLLTSDLNSWTFSVLLNATPVAVAVQDLGAEAVDRGIVLRWRLSHAAVSGFERVRVERSDRQDGSWRERATLVPQPGMSLQDTDVESGRTYWYRLALLAGGGAVEYAGPMAVRAGGFQEHTDLQVALGKQPGTVSVRYRIAREGVPVQLDIYDVRGRLVRALEHRPGSRGTHVHLWDGGDAAGRRAARGIYFVQLRAGNERLTRRAVLLGGSAAAGVNRE